MSKLYFQLVLSFLFIQISNAQIPEKWNSSQIEQAIEKLNVLGNVLYVAAHPDDENTRLITYFANYHHVNTAYISLTRGSGGQNLIGKELKETLGIIRTHELMEARKIDGGHQFFSRAKDFGYTKNPNETFQKWDKNEVLQDLVYTIRLYRPDIVINRFNHRTEGNTHGHHTVSAMLSVEAFELAGNPNAFSNQLNEVEVWQPKAIYFNDSSFFYSSQQAFKKADHTNFLAIPIGKYYPRIGLSNNEIAALSRSQHKSQGFGNIGSRGDETEYLEFLKGEKKPSKEVFEYIDISWNRLQNTKDIQLKLQEITANFNSKKPWESIKDLAELHKKVSMVKDDFWRKKKLSEIEKIIQHAAGLFIEAITNQKNCFPGEEIEIQLEIINRSPIDIVIANILFNEEQLIGKHSLEENKKKIVEHKLKIPENTPYSNPFWLNEDTTESMYRIYENSLKNSPTNPFHISIKILLEVAGISFSIEREVVYKTNDPIEGEVYKKLLILPEVSIKPDKEKLVFNNFAAQKIQLEIVNYADSLVAELILNQLKNWKIETTQKNLYLQQKGASTSLEINLSPTKNAKRSLLLPKLVYSNGKEFNCSVSIIDYPHIENFAQMKQASIELIPLQLNIQPKKIGYIQGAGDKVDIATKNLGFDIEKLSIQNLQHEPLINYDVIILGIRAFNVHDELEFLKHKLFDFAKNGGHLIIQYQTSQGLKAKDISPVQVQLNRGRVTDENAEVSFKAINHSFLNHPNNITLKDFDGWEQERGLYFAEEWDASFEAILSMADPNEEQQKGSLISTPYGNGQITYTGLSFFRQLPAGIEGAYKLWANIISFETTYNKNKEEEFLKQR